MQKFRNGQVTLDLWPVSPCAVVEGFVTVGIAAYRPLSGIRFWIDHLTYFYKSPKCKLIIGKNSLVGQCPSICSSLMPLEINLPYFFGGRDLISYMIRYHTQGWVCGSTSVVERRAWITNIYVASLLWVRDFYKVAFFWVAYCGKNQDL